MCVLKELPHKCECFTCKRNRWYANNRTRKQLGIRLIPKLIPPEGWRRQAQLSPCSCRLCTYSRKSEKIRRDNKTKKDYQPTN